MKKKKRKGIWFYGLSGSGKTFASKIILRNITKSIQIDGDEVRKHISFDLGYNIRDRKIQIRRILGLVKISLKSKLFPVASSVYMDKEVARELKKLGVDLIKIERDLRKIIKKHKTYKNKKNVVGRDISLKKISSTLIYNSGGKKFCKAVKKLIK
tara:strand:- start:220 stop:684 length:465 start_codon:yes stop_codon:yes gene_type:complete